MKYQYQPAAFSREQRKQLNEKVLYLIDSGAYQEYGITGEDIYNAYTGDGGLHGLERSDYSDYHSFSEAKKEIENGQFFSPPELCGLVAAAIRPADYELVADLTCGKGSFFNFFPVEANLYGCELDMKAYKVAHFLYPQANLTQGDIRTYKPEPRFDYVVGNPPFHLRWRTESGEELLSQLFYCMKAAELLKSLGILALIVPQSFLADPFMDKKMIREMEKRFSFLGQVKLPEDAFAYLGVKSFATKLQFWQKSSAAEGWTARRYEIEPLKTLDSGYDLQQAAEWIYQKILMLPKADLERNKSRILLELAKEHQSSREFIYQTQKLLYQIKAHPAVRDKYMKCCEYLHRFYTQVKPPNMSYEEWCRVKLTEAKVIAYLRTTLRKQNKAPERDVIALVKQEDCLVYKGYSAKVRRQMTDSMRQPVPIYQAVLDGNPDDYPGFSKMLRGKRREYDVQNQPFSNMDEDADIDAWLRRFELWDEENEEYIRLNDIQRHDINLILQKQYGMLQWEQGSGKTLAGIAVGLYRMERQNVHSTWVVSSAISIRNNWDVVLKNYNIQYTFVERLADLRHIRPGDFVLLTLNKLGQLQRHIRRWIKQHNQKIQLVLDESDEIANPDTVRAKASLACFRRSHFKLLTTGTSTRNNISEFAPQMELLYNNSINMISWCTELYHYDRKTGDLEASPNSYYGEPIPAYKKGYKLFAASHLPEKATVFGVNERTQDIYNSDVLSDLLGKTVITRTFPEIVGKELRRIHQVPVDFTPEEQAVYRKIIKDFHSIQRRYFASTGDHRKDSMLRLIQQITLLLRFSAAPNSLGEYHGDVPVKILTAVELAAQWPNEIVAIGVRHKSVLDRYAEAVRAFLPDRPLFVVTGASTSFAKRRALRKTLRESGNGILLCTQQSLPSSVNFEYVNRVIIPELHYNNAAMSQFYMRFIRYNSTAYKDIYFLTYAGSLESNLMQMVLVKEKLNLFMKGQDTDLDEIYKKFGIDYDLLSLLMRREVDEDGHFEIRWGEQKIA